MLNKLNLLFLCTGNSCRSQMAEGFTRAIFGEIIEPYSAGITKSQLDPRAVVVMEEVGIDISGQHSKTPDEITDVPFDFVVTVCSDADQRCPTLPGQATRLHVPFDDPPHLAASEADEAAALEHYRRVRDEIQAFCQTIPEKMQG
ncbi:MAG: arsenate reductase [Planctomycetaceae bacterium]|nr:arsenate reductase [Planctomycetaceae bacterium]